MDVQGPNRWRGGLTCLATCALAITLGLRPAGATEDRVAELQAQADAMVARVEEAAQTYTQATTEVDNLAAQIAENEARTADIEARLPAQRERTAASIKALYLFQQSSPGLLELILSSEDFNDFITTVRYIDAIHARNTAEIQALASLEDELVQTQAALSMELDTASKKQQEALVALDEVRTVRSELQEQARTLALAASDSPTDRAEAVSIAQEAVDAAREAVSDLPEEVIEATTPPEERAPLTVETVEAIEEAFEELASPPAEEVGAEPTTDTAEAPVALVTETATSAEVSSWAARIDAYLAGSPLAGYGIDFAQAAVDYGVDPRISPAISCIESGKGAVCFRPHNAWGWGGVSWPDWPTAIRGHVSGFASGYGSTLTLEGAKLYASNDIYETWYNLVLAEMSKI